MKQIKFGALAAMGAVVLFACSSPETAPAGSGKTAASKKAPSSTSSSSSSSGAPASASSAAAPGPGATAPAGGDDDDDAPSACEQQCIAKFPNGRAPAEAADEQWTTCACAATACAAQCGQTEMCKDEGTAIADGDACATCLDGAAVTACNSAQAAACTGDCASYQSCVEACDGGGD